MKRGGLSADTPEVKTKQNIAMRPGVGIKTWQTTHACTRKHGSFVQ